MDRVKLNVKADGTATIEGGEDTFVGRLLAGHKGKVKINSPYIKVKEVTIAKKGAVKATESAGTPKTTTTAKKVGRPKKTTK